MGAVDVGEVAGADAVVAAAVDCYNLHTRHHSFSEGV